MYSYQMYKCEHGLTTAAEQRAADLRADEIAAALAAALADLRAGLGRIFRLRRRLRPAGLPANAKAAPERALPTVL